MKSIFRFIFHLIRLRSISCALWVMDYEKAERMANGRAKRGTNDC